MRNPINSKSFFLTPLLAILQTNEIMMHRAEDEEVINLLRISKNSSKLLLFLVNDMLVRVFNEGAGSLPNQSWKVQNESWRSEHKRAH